MRPDEGERLKAFIVAAEGAIEDASEGASEGASEQSLTVQLDAWMRARVASAARPASYTFGAALPRQRNGKAADWIIDGD